MRDNRFYIAYVIKHNDNRVSGKTGRLTYEEAEKMYYKLINSPNMAEVNLMEYIEVSKIRASVRRG